MEPFCDHLCADEYVGFVGAKLPKEIFMARLLGGGVAVHAKGADAGEKRVKRAFDVFCAKSFELERFKPAARRTRARDRLSIIA